MHWLAIFLGGGLGASARFLVGRAMLEHLGDGFPWGTLAVNWIGCLAVGVAAAWFLADTTPQSLRLFVLTGLLGGFTTFSAFGLETTEMIARGAVGSAALYVAGSLAGGIVGVGLGLSLGRQLAA